MISSTYYVFQCNRTIISGNLSAFQIGTYNIRIKHPDRYNLMVAIVTVRRKLRPYIHIFGNPVGSGKFFAKWGIFRWKVTIVKKIELKKFLKKEEF